jgi:hypothetical protein
MMHRFILSKVFIGTGGDALSASRLYLLTLLLYIFTYVFTLQRG